MATVDLPIVRDVARRWWVVALRGVLAILFGVMALIWPGLTLAALVLLFGAYSIADGVAAIVVGARSKWWGMLLLGVLGIAAGVVAFLYPGLTAIALLYVIAAWAIVRGILEIVAAVALRREIEGEWVLILAGLASLAFGVLLMLFPGAGALSVIWMIGGFSIALGVLLLILAFRLRSLPRRLSAFAG